MHNKNRFLFPYYWFYFPNINLAVFSECLIFYMEKKVFASLDIKFEFSSQWPSFTRTIYQIRPFLLILKNNCRWVWILSKSPDYIKKNFQLIPVFLTFNTSCVMKISYLKKIFKNYYKKYLPSLFVKSLKTFFFYKL